MYMHMHMHIAYVHVYVYVYVCLSIYIYMYIHTYIHMTSFIPYIYTRYMTNCTTLSSRRAVKRVLIRVLYMCSWQEAEQQRRRRRARPVRKLDSKK